MEWRAEATRTAALRDLRRIPGVGPSIAGDLYALGVDTVASLRERDPQQLYEQLCDLVGDHVDRCVLYVFRCACYFATTSRPDPELLKWWHWKESPVPVGLAVEAGAPDDGEGEGDTG